MGNPSLPQMLLAQEIMSNQDSTRFWYSAICDFHGQPCVSTPNIKVKSDFSPVRRLCPAP